MRKGVFFEFIFLVVLFVYAIITTKGATISWGLLPLFYGLKQLKIIKNSKVNLKKLFIGLTIFFSLIIINFFAVYSFKYAEVTLPHPDFGFYFKIASYFNQIGIENNYTAKNILFNNMNFATPYRFFDTWLLAFLLKILPFSNFNVFQIIFIPFLWFLVSYSVYKNIEVENYWIKILLAIAFNFLFGDKLISLLTGTTETCVVSYSKLSVFFCAFLFYFKTQFRSDNLKHDSLLILAFLPILIQTTFPIYIYIFVYIIFYHKYFLDHKKITFSIILSMIYFVVFYGYNYYLSRGVFQIGQFQFVKSFWQYSNRLLSISFSLIKSKIFIFLLISLLFFLITEGKGKKEYLRINILAFFILFCGVIIYSLFPSSPNSYQLMTNFIFPVYITVTFLMWIDCIGKLKKKWKIYCYLSILIYAIFGAYNQYSNMGFFNVKDTFSNSNDHKFSVEAIKILQNVKNPIGLTFWSDQFVNRSNFEHFDQYGTRFLMKAGPNFDVVCLTALKVKEKGFADKVSKHYSAIGVYKRLNHFDNKNLEEKFYNSYKFGYLISDLSPKLLPHYINIDNGKYIYDKVSKVFFYKLK